MTNEWMGGREYNISAGSQPKEVGHLYANQACLLLCPSSCTIKKIEDKEKERGLLRESIEKRIMEVRKNTFKRRWNERALNGYGK